MRIIYLDNQDEAITGGQKYNHEFKKFLEEYSQIVIENMIGLACLYQGWKRYIAPILGLKRIRLFKDGDVIFWGDTPYKYLTLLLIATVLFKKTKNIVIIHHFLWLDQKGLFGRINKLWMNSYYRLMDVIVVPSPYTKDIAEKIFPNKQILYIPIPFESQCVPSDEYETGNLLFVGTIEPRKGLIFLLESMSIFHRHSKITLKLNVIGKVVDTKYKEYIDEYIDANGLNVHFWGRVTDEQLNMCYRKAEVFAFPSLLEGYGIVLIEAMQQGLPVVCFNNSAMPYTIKDGVNGYLASNKDSDDFAMKLLKICGNSENRSLIQRGIIDTISQIKTQVDFQEGIKFFWDTIKDN